ncbi:hypothetical protein DFH11DRAFT_310488 [Phellopilus nigrolimitatus]|nr:hypothetical protein DFH11DRAFT_310488 [Phellopilus nigrolimitatus]
MVTFRSSGPPLKASAEDHQLNLSICTPPLLANIFQNLYRSTRMSGLWFKPSTVTPTRKNFEPETSSNRQLSFRRLTCKSRQQRLRLLAEVYYSADPSSYDDPAADVLVLCAEYNPLGRIAVESRLLDAFDEDGGLQPHKQQHTEKEILQLVEGSIPAIEQFYLSATRITLRTALTASTDGQPTPRLTYLCGEEHELVFPFVQLPASLASGVPLARITDLTRLGPAGSFGLTTGVDRVQWGGHDGTFAFKRAGRNTEATVGEMEILVRPPPHSENSAQLVQFAAVVVDQRGRLRGFLAIFEPYGSLEEIFLNRRTSTSTDSAGGSAVFPRQPDWPLKLRWSTQLARGLSALHADSAGGPIVLGNLNPRNVLVSHADGYSLVIAGLRGAATPTGMRFPARWAAPERVRRASYALGPALDVANLGMVLWALAEESFDRFPGISSPPRRSDDISKAAISTRSGLWRKDNIVTPGWYKLLVESCVEEEPARRPSAADVAAVLSRELDRLSD